MLKVRRDLVVSKLFRTFASETNNSVGDNLKNNSIMANVATPKWLQDIAEKHGYNVEVCDYSTKEYGSDHSVVFTSHFKKVMDPQPFFMTTIDDKEGLVRDMRSYAVDFDPQDEAHEYCDDFDIEDEEESENILYGMREIKLDVEEMATEIEQTIKK
jgi:hypothetical protein